MVVIDGAAHVGGGSGWRVRPRGAARLHMAAAWDWEIARELSLAGAEDEAALFGGGVADSVA